LTRKFERNEERFRDANERLKLRLADLAWDNRVPFICECADADCMEVVELTLTDYESVRSRNAYVLVAGHENRLEGVVIERGSRHVVVEPAGG
jgi:hypothetical protein